MRQGQLLELEGHLLSSRWRQLPHINPPHPEILFTLFQMGNLVAALVELDEATKILPGNIKLKKDADMLRETINGGGS